MTHDEYQQALDLLSKMMKDEKERVRNRPGGAGVLFAAFVDSEVFSPMQRVIDLLETRAQQTKGQT